MSRFKVINGVNRIGAPNPATTDLSGSRGCSRYGNLTSPSGITPDPFTYRPPPSYAERIHDIVAPDFAKIKTHKTERNEK